MDEPAAQALPSLRGLALHAAPTGALDERATPADLDELVAVLTAQRALPEADRAFEGGDDVLDRLLRSTHVWRGGAAPPGDPATADDIQKHLVFFLTFDKNLFAREASVVRLLQDSTHWFNAVRSPSTPANDYHDADGDADNDVFELEWASRVTRLRAWRAALSAALETWWVGWIRAQEDLPPAIDMDHVGRQVFRTVSRQGIADWRELRDLVGALLSDATATPLAFRILREQQGDVPREEFTNSVYVLAKAALAQHIQRSLEYRAGVAYERRFVSEPTDEGLDEVVVVETVLLYKGLDGLTELFRARHREKIEEWDRFLEDYQPTGADTTAEEARQQMEELWEMRAAHLVNTSIIQHRLLGLMEEIRPPPPPTQADFPPLVATTPSSRAAARGA